MSLFLPPIHLQFTPEEWAILSRPIVAKKDGGAQSLLRRLVANMDDDAHAASIEDSDLQRLYKLAYSYGDGGYQEMAKAILRAAFRAKWVPA